MKMLLMTIALGLISPALADETVKSRGPSDKPGRALEQGTVKSRGPSDKPGRAVDGGAMDPTEHAHKHPREIEAAK